MPAHPDEAGGSDGAAAREPSLSSPPATRRPSILRSAKEGNLTARSRVESGVRFAEGEASVRRRGSDAAGEPGPSAPSGVFKPCRERRLSAEERQRGLEVSPAQRGSPFPTPRCASPAAVPSNQPEEAGQPAKPPSSRVSWLTRLSAARQQRQRQQNTGAHAAESHPESSAVLLRVGRGGVGLGEQRSEEFPL